MSDLKLGLQTGYWGAGPDPRMVDIAQEAERLGYDASFRRLWEYYLEYCKAWFGSNHISVAQLLFERV